MSRQRGQGGIKLLALVLAVLALVLLVLRLTNVLDEVALASALDAPGVPSSTTPPPGTPTPRPTAYPTERPTVTFVPQDLDVSDSTSPADQWADQLVAAALPVLSDGSLTSEGFVWWQNPAENGPLAANDDGLWLGGRQLEIDELERIEVLVPTAAGSSQLKGYGTVTWEGGALMLSAVGGADGATSTRWLLSSTRPGTAVRALIQQAAEQGYRLTAAYSTTFEKQASLVLTSAAPVDVVAEPTEAPADATAAPTLTPVPSVQPTPTRAPEALMGQTVAEHVDPAIASLADLPEASKLAFAETHPWVGLLTWTESGPQISGRDIAIQEARELTVYVIASEGDDVLSERLLSATYNGSFTRLTDEQLIFHGQRMDEILYWMVRTAFDEGGQLLVAYDDFGTRQALTLVDLRLLSPAQ